MNRAAGPAPGLILSGCAMALALALARPGLAHQDARILLALHAALALGFLVALRVIGTGPRPPADLGVVLFFAAVFRGLLVDLPPTLTTDVLRYRWDGGLVAALANPYTTVPGGSSTLPHATVPTVYPPAAQLLFGLTVSLGGTDLMFKLLALAGDAATIAAVTALARLTGSGPASVLAWAWHPAVVVSFAGGAHVDSVAIALLVAAVVTAGILGNRLAAILVGLAASVKVAPIALWPSWWALLGGPLALAPLAAVLPAVPFASAGPTLVTGLVMYVRHWDHMGLLFRPASLLCGPGLARVACLAALALLVARSFARSLARPCSPGATRADLASRLVETTRELAGGALFLTPTLHPWYVCWIVPFIDPRANPVLLTLSLTAAGGYGVQAGVPALGTWGDERWSWAITWVPVAVVAWVSTRSANSRPSSGSRNVEQDPPGR